MSMRDSIPGIPPWPKDMVGKNDWGRIYLLSLQLSNSSDSWLWAETEIHERVKVAAQLKLGKLRQDWVELRQVWAELRQGLAELRQDWAELRQDWDMTELNQDKTQLNWDKAQLRQTWAKIMIQLK